MKTQQGMATLMATSTLLLMTGLWGWLSFKSVMAETTRSQHQMFATQALSNSEALLETALAYTESIYVQNGAAADATLWLNAKPQDCTTQMPSSQWQCLQLPLEILPLPDGVDLDKSQVRLFRDPLNAPHKVILTSDITLNTHHPGSGSRATVQQALFLPVNASGSEFNSALWPAGIDPSRVQRILGSWKNAGN
jgi:hypothetical protein